MPSHGSALNQTPALTPPFGGVDTRFLRPCERSVSAARLIHDGFMDWRCVLSVVCMVSVALRFPTLPPEEGSGCHRTVQL